MPWAEVVVELDPSQSAVKDAAVRVEGVRGPGGAGGAWVARPGSLVELRCWWSSAPKEGENMAKPLVNHGFCNVLLDENMSQIDPHDSACLVMMFSK